MRRIPEGHKTCMRRLSALNTWAYFEISEYLIIFICMPQKELSAVTPATLTAYWPCDQGLYLQQSTHSLNEKQQIARRVGCSDRGL